MIQRRVTEPRRSESDPFYVNYLPVPRGIGRFAWRIAIALIIGAAAAGGFIAGAQRDPGGAAWEMDQTVTLRGTLVERPYPILISTAADGSAHATLLVGEGKLGVTGRIGGMHGGSVAVRGTLIRRQGRSMLELIDAPDAIVAMDGTPSDSAQAAQVTGDGAPPIRLIGEIIDPKCHLGAMKPGDGKTHKACAALCLRGGIPPMFIALDAERRPIYHLIVDPAGGPVSPQTLELLAEHVGEPVQITGQAGRLADLPVIKLQAAGIRRLGR